VDEPLGIGQFAVIQPVARSVSMEVSPINGRDASEIERHRGLRAYLKWWPDRDSECVGGSSSRSAHPACRCGLSLLQYSNCGTDHQLQRPVIPNKKDCPKVGLCGNNRCAAHND